MTGKKILPGALGALHDEKECSDVMGTLTNIIGWLYCKHPSTPQNMGRMGRLETEA